jgi:hypothetical protein
MLLRLFKGTGPGVIFLIIVTLLSVWFSAFFKLRGFSLASVSLMSFLIVNLNTTLFFINERTFLPAFIYILISGLFPQYQLLNPAIFSALFLMLAIRRIMDAYRVQGTAYSFFDAGILIGTGSLFYANLIWFGILVIIGIALLRTGNIKEILISVIGLLTPYILTFGIYYVLGKDLKDLRSILEYNLFGKQTVFEFTRLTIVAVIYLGLITLMSIVYLLVRMNTKKIQSRKTFSLFIWGFLIALGVYFILPSVSVEIVWLAGIPVSYFLTHYFVFSRKKVVPEILFSVFFVLILLIQILYLK